MHKYFLINALVENVDMSKFDSQLGALLPLINGYFVTIVKYKMRL